MASSVYSSTPETTNANRACRAVLGPCTDGLRDTLRHYVMPLTFHRTIKLKEDRLPRLTKDQRDLILPRHGSYTGNYGDMDISLLYILLRNISGIPPHSKGWGNDPDPRDSSLSANIERIRLVRNHCVHSCDPSMSNSDFNSIWSTIRSVMVDLDAFLVNGNKYEKEVDFLRQESMDPENDLHYEEELRKQVEEDTKTREMVVNLERRIEDTSERVEKLDDKMEKITKSPIPPNVREQYDVDVQKWREEDKLYYETHSFPSVMEKVRNQPYITFVGVPGSGKSATAHHIALKLQEEGYEVVPTRDVKKMEDYGDPRNPQVFVIDDVVGVFGLQKTNLDVLTNYEQKITQPCMVKSRTLMTCREAVFNETLPYKPFLTKEEAVITLHSSDHALNDKDKKQILKKYGINVDLMSPALLTSTSRMFPLLCKLFSKETKFKALGSKFFFNPVPCIIDELDDMQRHNKLNYATLVLCMLNENSLSKYILRDRKNEHFMKFNMKSDTLENCELESHTNTFKFVKAMSAMEGTYMKQCGVQYTFIHDSMFEICAYHYGKQFPDQMLLYMSSSYIANHVKPQTSESGIESNDKNNEREESSDLCIRLHEDQYPLLAERLYRDIQNMKLYDVFRNQVLKQPQVCQAFIGVLETKSYTELKSVFLSSDGEVDKIAIKGQRVEKEGNEWERQVVLVDQRKKQDDKEEKLLYEYTHNVRVISWSKSGIDTCNKRESEINRLVKECRLLVLSCYSGDVQTVRVLLPVCKKAINGIGKVSKSLLWYCSPLTAACEGGHLCIVKELLEAGADVKLQTNNILKNNTPLTTACERGHVSVVKELVKAAADVNLQGNYRNTPLIAASACKRGHVSVVKELVKAGADVNLQGNYRNTSLIAACKRGHVSVVKELVKAGADVNLQGADVNLQTNSILEKTPLITACKGGHVSVVKELVKAGADVNLQDREGNTPLIAACEGGHVSVVKELVKAAADVNLRNKYSDTPLIAACKQGHASVVEELVKSGADVNLQKRGRNREGDTPLIATVRQGSLSTVKYLVQHGADLDTQVVDINVSAVYTALILNKPDIVKYLIQEQNKITPGQFNGNAHLFNCLVYIRHAGVKTDSRDDVVVTDRSVWCMYRWGDLWRTIFKGDCDALRRLMCLGLDVNQSIQLYDIFHSKSDVRPLLYTLINEEHIYVLHRMEKVRMLLGAGVDVNVRVRYSEYDSVLDRVRYRKYHSVLDREGVSVLERTRRLVSECSKSEYSLYRDRLPEYKRLMCEIKEHVRRHSV
ncbi:uncharacterized protein LOC125658404 [Ostrea edulis]|uniref:uncharacterized protein LOC125658404 n=1 Tax=Ostrea edulis TaxID=37623 RepID=UPI0024AEBB9C|nr:uncharacterized protein LOC125658404 [Ostrea edulis]